MDRKPVLSLIILTGLVLVEVLWIHAHHPVFSWQKIPGFYALLGTASGIALMKIAKALGKRLYRREDYYRE